MAYDITFKEPDTANMIYRRLRDWYRLNGGKNVDMGNIKYRNSTIILADESLLRPLNRTLERAAHLTPREKRHEVRQIAE